MRLIARFAQEKENFFEVITVYDEAIIKEQLHKKRPFLISIVKDYPAASWFERKIADDFGIEIQYAEDERPLVKHEHFPKTIFPMRKDFIVDSIKHDEPIMLPAQGEGVIIGPTHPYHLESFQFQTFDSNGTLLHFEQKAFYKYRGIEKMLEGLDMQEAGLIIERISASGSIAYQTVFLDILLQASKKNLPESIKKRHVFLLELERIINHLTDLSVLCQLLKFHEGSEFFINFVEDARVSMANLTGHRFGFSSVWIDAELANMDEVYAFLFSLEKALLEFEKWIESKHKILKETVLLGKIDRNSVIDYGLVGLMARCVDIELDRRKGDTFYEKHDFHINLEEEGDTFSRFNIRLTEMLTSLRLMRNLAKSKALPFYLGTVVDGEYYAYVESAAGELMMYIAIKNEKIERFFVRDPSFLNIQALPLFIKETKTSNFSLVMKSIPLHISAIDL